MPNLFFTKFILPQLSKFIAQRLADYSRRRRERKLQELAARCAALENEAPPVTIKRGGHPFLFTTLGLLLGTFMGAIIGLVLAQLEAVQQQAETIKQKLPLDNPSQPFANFSKTKPFLKQPIAINKGESQN